MSGGAGEAPTLAVLLGDDPVDGLAGQGAVRLPQVVLGTEPGPGVDLAVGELLGKGGMATVRRARHLALDRDVAVKRSRDPSDPRAMAGLLREAVIGARIQHPNVVPVHFVGETPSGEALVVMQAVGGVPWDRLVREEPVGPASIGRHLEIFHAICQAVSFAHSQGYLHRDLKPANVRIGDFGEVYLLDWGIAASLDSRALQPAGTPAYMAPEAGGSVAPDVRQDVHGLGATLLHVFTGQPPERTTSGDGPRVDPLALPEGLPAGLGPIVERACAADPADRHPTVEALRQDVARWQADLEIARILEAAEARRDELLRTTDRPEARERFAVARFAYEQILEGRPAHATAVAGLVACYDRMIRLEATHGDVGAAEALLALHPAAGDALRAEVRATLSRHAEQAAERERLVAYARSHDVRRISRAVAWVLGSTFAASVVSVAATYALVGAPGENPALQRVRSVLLIAPIWAVLVAASTWQWRKLGDDPAGRRMILTFTGFMSFLTFGRILTEPIGMTTLNGLPVYVVYEPAAIVAMLLGGVTFSRRFVVPAVGAALGWAAVIWAMHQSQSTLTLVYNIAMFGSLGFGIDAWRRILAAEGM